jgi:hypothetical protein
MFNNSLICIGVVSLLQAKDAKHYADFILLCSLLASTLIFFKKELLTFL